MMKAFMLVAAMSVVAATGAAAADATCTAQSTEKKLAGAAKTSFMKKCVTDAVGT